MRCSLTRHPDFPCEALSRIEVDVVRPHRGALVLTYVLTGAVRDLALPPIAAPVRTDELWRHTCFEAFVRTARSQTRFELNFAPSTQWAAYRFTGYREGMAPADMAAPRIEVTTTYTSLELAAALDLAALAHVPWRLALSAVIEEASGAKSYWALAHPPGKPDFHHDAGFVLDLAAPERP